LIERPPEAAMGELGRSELLGRLAQREARHMRRLRPVGDRLLAVPAAPIRHQRMERIPIGDPIRLAGKAPVGTPLG